jgi:hypothetical protein
MEERKGEGGEKKREGSEGRGKKERRGKPRVTYPDQRKYEMALELISHPKIDLSKFCLEEISERFVSSAAFLRVDKDICCDSLDSIWSSVKVRKLGLRAKGKGDGKGGQSRGKREGKRRQRRAR